VNGRTGAGAGAGAGAEVEPKVWVAGEKDHQFIID